MVYVSSTIFCLLFSLASANTTLDGSTPTLYDREDVDSLTNSSRARAAFEPRAFAFFPAGTDRPDGFVQFDFTSETVSRIEVRLGNFPEGKGPFSYHVHTDPVPGVILDPAKDCMAAKTHLDPAKRGETTPCASKEPETCQVGDLSGKFGTVSGDIKPNQIFREVYQDNSLSWARASPAFFGNRSVVIHQASTKARLACANILFM